MSALAVVVRSVWASDTRGSQVRRGERVEAGGASVCEGRGGSRLSEVGGMYAAGTATEA